MGTITNNGNIAESGVLQDSGVWKGDLKGLAINSDSCSFGVVNDGNDADTNVNNELNTIIQVATGANANISDAGAGPDYYFFMAGPVSTGSLDNSVLITGKTYYLSLKSIASDGTVIENTAGGNELADTTDGGQLYNMREFAQTSKAKGGYWNRNWNDGSNHTITTGDVNHSCRLCRRWRIRSSRSNKLHGSIIMPTKERYNI